MGEMPAQSREWELVSTVIDALGGNSLEVRRRAMLNLVSVEVVSEGLNRSIRHAIEFPDFDDEPFDPWQSGVPWRLDLRVFDQGEWWVDVLRRPYRLVEMSTEYLRNVQALLRVKSSSLFDSYHLRFTTPAPPVTSSEWVDSTDLMRAIGTEITAREQSGEPG